MARDYGYSSEVSYDSGGNKGLAFDTSGTLGGLDTDDGFWNVGDQLVDSHPLVFAGSYQADGHLFLAFSDGFGGPIRKIYSPTAPSTSSGYPSNVSPPPSLSAPLALCFLARTEIAAVGGNKLIEDLRIGERLRSKSGEEVTVKWIGRQTVSTRFGPADRLMLVRFAAGSLGEGVPHSDLTVTADHGMLVGGVICHAGALVNGTTITRVPLADMGETYTVYHIETEEHEIILANGAPAETFIDNVSRRVFDNFAEFEALYGDVPEMEELPYPRAMSTRQVPERIKAKLTGKAVA
ncbi:Hint domain-containing protein [Nioella sediminis]|uniref:Hint domain-containing protein n=1 Tax=Nioella sediminis TaxID=1912092 RepID=UPI000AB64F7A|nr:Hint domain-containing protein [Nioella sediminis]